MKDPMPVNLTTSEEMQARCWAAEARDSDGHLISCHVEVEDGDEYIAEWINECTKNGETVTFFPKPKP